LSDDGYSGGSHISSSFRRPGSSSSDEFSDDLYAFDEHAIPRGSHRQRRRSSSVSFNSRPTIIPPNGSPYQGAPSIPIPVNQTSYNYSGGSPYHTGGSPYHTGGSPYHTGGSPYSNTSQFHPASYPQQYPSNVQGVPLVGGSYDPNHALVYQGSGSYPQQTYIQPQPGMSQTIPMAPGSAILIQQPTRRHKHHHKHRSGSRDGRRRHRSHSDAEYSLHY